MGASLGKDRCTRPRHAIPKIFPKKVNSDYNSARTGVGSGTLEKWLCTAGLNMQLLIPSEPTDKTHVVRTGEWKLCANPMSRKQKVQLSTEAQRKLRATSPAKHCSLPGRSMTTDCEGSLYTRAKWAIAGRATSPELQECHLPQRNSSTLLAVARGSWLPELTSEEVRLLLILSFASPI